MAARTQSKVAHGLRVVLTLFKLIAGSWAARSHELLRARLTQVRQVQKVSGLASAFAWELIHTLHQTRSISVKQVSYTAYKKIKKKCLDLLT